MSVAMSRAAATTEPRWKTHSMASRPWRSSPTCRCSAACGHQEPSRNIDDSHAAVGSRDDRTTPVNRERPYTISTKATPSARPSTRANTECYRPLIGVAFMVGQPLIGDPGGDALRFLTQLGSRWAFRRSLFSCASFRLRIPPPMARTKAKTKAPDSAIPWATCGQSIVPPSLYRRLAVSPRIVALKCSPAKRGRRRRDPLTR